KRFVDQYISNYNYEDTYYRIEIKYSLLTEMINICKSFGKELEEFLLFILNKIFRSINRETQELINIRLVKEKLIGDDSNENIGYWSLTQIEEIPSARFRKIKLNCRTFPDYLEDKLYVQFENLY